MMNEEIKMKYSSKLAILPLCFTLVSACGGGGGSGGNTDEPTSSINSSQDTNNEPVPENVIAEGVVVEDVIEEVVETNAMVSVTDAEALDEENTTLIEVTPVVVEEPLVEETIDNTEVLVSEEMSESVVEETIEEPSQNTLLNGSVPIEENEVAVDDAYQPDIALLSENAGSSNDLYVESGFRFENFRTFSVNITAADQEGSPIPSTIVKISSIASDITDLNDQRINERELLSLFKTDANGQLYQTLELPRNVTSVLLELDTIGVENAVILNIGELSSITHQFL